MSTRNDRMNNGRKGQIGSRTSSSSSSISTFYGGSSDRLGIRRTAAATTTATTPPSASTPSSSSSFSTRRYNNHHHDQQNYYNDNNQNDLFSTLTQQQQQDQEEQEQQPLYYSQMSHSDLRSYYDGRNSRRRRRQFGGGEKEEKIYIKQLEKRNKILFVIVSIMSLGLIYSYGGDIDILFKSPLFTSTSSSSSSKKLLLQKNHHSSLRNSKSSTSNSENNNNQSNNNNNRNIDNIDNDDDIEEHEIMLEDNNNNNNNKNKKNNKKKDNRSILLKPKINPDIPLDELINYKDTYESFTEEDNTAVFWHIPKAGGSTIKDIIGPCHRKVWASEFGITDGHENDTILSVVYPTIGGGRKGLERSPFINVDTTTINGIDHAINVLDFPNMFHNLGTDAIVTPYIYESNLLFTRINRGRLFTILRHPIERVISMFYYIQVATWEPTYKPELKNWTLLDYAKSSIIENNWMVRMLSNKLQGEILDEHYIIAKEVIKRKFLIGLLSNIDETMNRIEEFFHWTYHINPINQELCRTKLLLSGGSNKNNNDSGNNDSDNENKRNKRENPKPGSITYEALLWQNKYDMKLYNYVKDELWIEQGKLFKYNKVNTDNNNKNNNNNGYNNVNDDNDDNTDLTLPYRKINSTCCKCYPPTIPYDGFKCPENHIQ